MTAICAARISLPEGCEMPCLWMTHQYLPGQRSQLSGRSSAVYLPGNGGCLRPAMMCAGWDGNEGKNQFSQQRPMEGGWEGLDDALIRKSNYEMDIARFSACF